MAFNTVTIFIELLTMVRRDHNHGIIRQSASFQVSKNLTDQFVNKHHRGFVICKLPGQRVPGIGRNTTLVLRRIGSVIDRIVKKEAEKRLICDPLIQP